MGTQYMKVVFGTINEIDFDFEDMKNWADWPDCQYESANRWYGYPVAVTDGVIGGVVQLSREAIVLDDLLAHIERSDPGCLMRARAQWEAWRTEHPGFGEGRFLLVFEYD